MKRYQFFITSLKIAYIFIIILVHFIPEATIKERKELEFIQKHLHKLLSLSTAIILIVLYNPFIKIKKDSHDDFIVFMSSIFLLLSEMKTVYQSFSYKNE